MTRFRQALLDELLTRVSDPVDHPVPAARTPLLRRRRLALGSAALAAFAVGGVVFATQATGTPAYAVTANPDGTVSVTVNRIADPAAANSDLRATGARVVVMLPSAEEDCPAQDRGTVLPIRLSDAVKSLRAAESGRGNVVRLRPDYIPADAVLVLVPFKADVGSAGPSLLYSWYAAPGPNCVVAPFPPSPAGPVPSASASSATD